MTDTPAATHISTLASALAKAQGEMQNAAINKENPYFNSRYADLAAIRDATVPALSKNGLCIYHIVLAQGENWIIRGILKHGETGESIISDFPLPGVFDKPQSVGSAITYGRRYTWAALCGIAAEEDDDANAAQGHPAAKPARQPPAPKTNVIDMVPQESKLISKEPVAVPKGADDDWTTWGQVFISHVRQSVLSSEADEWMKLNGVTLDAMEKQVSKTHKRLSQAIFEIYTKLGTKDALS